MEEFAPSRYWLAEKDGVAVKKYETTGKTLIDLPDGINAVSVDSLDDLREIETNADVLTKTERLALAVRS